MPHHQRNRLRGLGQVVRDVGDEIRAVPGLHDIYEIGFVVQGAGRSIYFAGDTRVHEHLPVIADPSQLEVAAELGADQMKQLSEGQPAEISTLSRPDVVMPAIVRQMPAPYGSGGTGAVQEQDRTTRFKLLDLKGQEVEAGATIVKIRIVLEHKDNVLWLPPEAVRAFEGRRFVVVRTGDRERRVTVKTGIETDDKIEILEGVKEGDLIVGQ